MVEEVASRLQLYFGQSFLVFWTRPYFFGPRIQNFLYFGPHRPYGIEGRLGAMGGGVAAGGRRGGSRPQLPPASRQLASVTAQV